MTNISVRGFHFCTVVWGHHYTDLFLKIAIPFQLSKNNLNALSFTDNKYHLYTSSEDLKIIQSSPVYSALSEIISVEINIIDDLIEKRSKEFDHYKISTLCHEDAAHKASKELCAFVLITPDELMPDGTYAKLEKLVKQGKRVVSCAGFRAKESLVPVLTKDTDLSISISPRELSRLSYEHIHIETKKYFVNSDLYFNHWPGWLFWNVEGKGMIQRGIHLCNMLVVPPAGFGRLLSSSASEGYAPVAPWDIGDFTQQITQNDDEIYVVEDSDDFFSVSLDPPSSNYENQKFSLMEVAQWIKKNTFAFHRYYLTRKIYIHFDDLTPEWEEVARDSDKVIDSLFACLEFFDREPEALDSLIRLKTERDTFKDQTNYLRFEGVKAYNMLGMEYHKTGRRDEAASALETSLSFFPYQMPAHRNLAVIYREQGNLEKALVHLQQAIQMNPPNLELWYFFVNILNERGLDGPTIEWLKQAAGVMPADPALRNALGQLGLKYQNMELLQLLFSMAGPK